MSACGSDRDAASFPRHRSSSSSSRRGCSSSAHIANTELYNNNNNDDDILDAGNRRQTIDILGLFFLGSKVARPTGLVDQTRPRGRCVYVSGARLRYAWPNQAAQILCRRRLTLIRPSSADGCCAGIGCSRYHQRPRRRQRWWTIESGSGR